MQDKKSNRRSSRRKWLRQMAVPATAVTLGSSASQLETIVLGVDQRLVSETELRK
jgi:hypothetical protein